MTIGPGETEPQTRQARARADSRARSRSVTDRCETFWRLRRLNLKQGPLASLRTRRGRMTHAVPGAPAIDAVRAWSAGTSSSAKELSGMKARSDQAREHA